MYASLVVPNSGGGDVPNSDVYKSATPKQGVKRMFVTSADMGKLV